MARTSFSFRRILLVALMPLWWPPALVGNQRSGEPSYEQAVVRWPDMRRPVTFLGCSNHLDEFGLMWNGNITATTVTRTDADRQIVQKRGNDSFQVSFSVGDRPNFDGRDAEAGLTEAALLDGYLPVTQVGLGDGKTTLRQEAFAVSSQGTCQASSGDESVFLRVRFTVEASGNGDSPIGLWLQVARNHTRYAMSTRRNVRIEPVAPNYWRDLRSSGQTLLDSRGLALMWASQEFQFHSQLPEALNSLSLRESNLDRNLCEFRLARKPGATLDLVFSFLPVSEGEVRTAGSMGHEQAQRAVVACWNQEISRGMQIRVPEAVLNNLWRFNVPLTLITADTYANGDQVLKTSTHHYEAYWPTPNAMHFQELIQRGYRNQVASFLKPFLDGKRRQPVSNTGASFSSSHGFISGPSEHLAISWVSDHGAILWAASEYYLLTRDAGFLNQWLPTLLEGMRWIAHERQITKLRGGLAAGLMPAGRATDANMQSNFVWSDAWVYRGLAAVCRVLEAIKHEETPRWIRERDDYRDTFQKTLRSQIEKTIRWTDAAGAKIPFVPWELRQVDADDLHAFYLDTGPMMLGVAGLVDPKDDVMTWSLKWLTEGPDSGRAYPDWSDFSERPSLRFEMSSVEPCYSWNIYLRFLRDERREFLEGFYSMAAGAVSRRFLGGVETRDGIQAVPAANAVIDNHLRNMLVFEDQKEPGLHVLRNSPSTWLQPGKEIRVDNAETYFGPISYRIVGRESGQIEAEIQAPQRTPVNWIRLHLYQAEGKPIARATVNGAPVQTVTRQAIDIRNATGTIRVTAQF
ncbi:MAG: hypothetical protein AB1898_16545 [Acidobacteriota bacterium]